jgi:hypothetical protein
VILGLRLRCNRIYTARRHKHNLFDWKAGPTVVPMDHELVSVKFAPKDMLLIGPER